MDMRKLMRLVEGDSSYQPGLRESVAEWPPTLKDDWAIAEYIEATSSDYVDEEYIREHYRGCHAVLKKVAVTDLEPGDPEHNERSEKKEKKYAKMDLATMPPLVVEDGQIMDGNHRFRVAVAKGATHVLCYVVECGLEEGRFDDENTYEYGSNKTAADYANMIWYHGSEEEFDQFEDGRGRYFGLWFAENPKLTGYYGANQYKVRIHMRNPLIVSEEEYTAGKPHGPTHWAKEAANGGHDAVVIQDIIDGDTESTICGVLDPSIVEILDKDIYVDEDAAFPLRKGVINHARGNYAALVAVMDPRDFIRLTTTNQQEYDQIFKDKFAKTVSDYKTGADPEFNKEKYNMPYLIVEYPSGKVIGHEGRHRAAMVAKEGGTRFPCYLKFRTGKSDVMLRYTREKKWDGPEEDMEQTFKSYDEMEAFKDELLRLRDDDDHPYWYSMFQSHRDEGYTMKGSPRSKPENWEYDPWKPEDMPDALHGQYNDAVTVPKSRIRVGVVKGYSHYR
jgi:hypothetical protein